MTKPTETKAETPPGVQGTDVVDVAVVGGGLAGLGGALTLGRARRSVLVIDAGHPRNAPAAHMHGYLTRDGENPLEMLRLGREEVRGYGGRVIEGTVVSITPLEGALFRLATDEGTSYLARRVLVTTGLVDEYPDIPGLRERWGRDVVHCPYCFGWELRERALVVLGTGPFAVMQALMWRQWSSDVVLFQHAAPEPTEEQSNQLAARGIAVVPGEVAAIKVDDDRVTGIRLASGAVYPREAVVIAPWFEARHGLLGPLGVTLVEHPAGIGRQVQADASGFTGVPGVWVAGNVLDVTAGVMQSAASGVTAAAALNADLTIEDTVRASSAAGLARSSPSWPAPKATGSTARQSGSTAASSNCSSPG
jgi:thioredoxin reductase